MRDGHRVANRVNGRIRIYLTLTIFVLLSAILSACTNDDAQPLPTLIPVAEVAAQPAAEANAGAGAAAVPTAEPVEVIVDDAQTVMTLWHNWQDEKAEALAGLTAVYEAAHPETKVVLVYQANLADAVNTAVPLGEGPDLILSPHDQLGHFAERGLASPVTPWFDAAYLAETFTPAAAAAVTWQDNLWGIPALQESIAIVYNKALMVDALIPENPTDFDTLLTNAITYHEANPGRYLLCNQSLSADSLDIYHTAPIFFGFGGSEETGYIDDQGQVFVDTPERAAAAEWLLAFMEAAPAEAGYEICQEGFTSGEFASWWTGSWALDALPGTGVEYGIRSFGRPYVHVTALFMGANSQERGHQEPAADFMAYFASPEVQTDLALAANIAPANRLALSSDAVQAQTSMAAFGEAAANGIPFPASPYADAQWEPIGKAVNNILNRVQSPEAALAEAQTAVEQAIESLKNQ
jgi:arabinogalactan oligomer/maltooligosaccharide transport system substrate-binding protein